MIVTIIVLSIVILILGFISVNLNSKVSVMEKELQEAADIETKAMNMYNAMLMLMIRTKREIDVADRSGAFEADDEVGFAFKAILLAIDSLVAALKDFEEDIKDNEPNKPSKPTGKKDKKKETR